MKTEERTLEHLRNSLRGKIYVLLNDEETQTLFFADAGAQGWTFGGTQPCDSPRDDLIALENEKQLSHVGFVGRIALQCRGGSGAKRNFHCVDYAKFRRGEARFMRK